MCNSISNRKKAIKVINLIQNKKDKFEKFLINNLKLPTSIVREIHSFL